METTATTSAVTSTPETLEVRQGDTLWGIAQARLDDGADWTALAALNLGRDMAPGTRFIDPDHVRVRWTLRLPAHVGRVHGGPAPPDSGGHLPELVALGLGSLACTALARRAARRRRLRPFVEDERTATILSDQAVDAAVVLHRFHAVPSLAAFESANRFLAWSLTDGTPRPGVRAVSVDPEGVTFWLSPRDPDPPQGFVSVDDGQAWRVGHAELDQHPIGEALAGPPAVPVAFPVGDVDGATWLVALGPGDVLPVLGESAHALWRGAWATLESWDWADTIVVVEDADDPVLRAETSGDPAVARHVLFFGDPRTLPLALAPRVAVVTDSPVAATDLTLLVDRHGATLHPMGRVLRPHLLSDETAGAIAELLDDRMSDRLGDWASSRAGAPASAGTGNGAGNSAGNGAGDRVGARVGAREGQAGGGSGIRAAALVPGSVDVRLLTPTPRLDGLREDLPPNRARRAVELVAYLALQLPDVVTSDRLRTRVLGSSDADATSKTLFNTAHAARRALGSDAAGAPLFPAATRNGHYQLSAEVSVDAHRAASLCSEARAQSEPEPAIAYYRAALELVEGEPLANVLSGYSWWEAEGHGGRLAAVLVDAACAMAALATRAGHLELARWGIEQARLVEPYSESLSRAAMEVAAAAGDPDRLRREWRACQRMIDALDPGSSPSQRTETLYGELSRGVLVPTDSGGTLAPSAPATG